MAKILLGFMGSGKSTIAKLLDENYVDMDALITEKIGMSILDFFAKEGEAAFRQIESETLAELIASDQVVSTGGGVVTVEKNRQLLKQNQENIYLKCDFETLYERIANDKENQRPLFLNNSKEDFQAIFDGRQAWYEEVASQTIDVASLSPLEIIEVIK